MAEQVNPHYDKLINDIGVKKDSIFEPCRVVSFDTKTLMVTTYGINSKSMKKNVIMLFPSMFLNTGIISFPVKDSVGLTFIGADNETYMLPAQFFPPVKETENSSVKSSSSPALFDELLSLETLEPGEQLIRSLSGAQIYVRNTGDVEMSTSKMHRLALNELEGSLETIVERIREYVGYSEYFSGVYDPKKGDDSKEHHVYATYFEEVPDWETDEVLTKDVIQNLIDANTPNESVFPLKKELPVAKMQMVNVFKEENDEKKISDVDKEELFYDFELSKKEEEVMKGRYKVQVSKEGALNVSSYNEKENKEVEIILSKDSFKADLGHAGIQSGVQITPSHASVYYGGGNVTIDGSGTTMSYNGGTSVRVTNGGEIIVSDRKGSRSLSSMLERIERLEAQSHGH